MALLRKEFTRAQHRSHTRPMASATLTRDQVLHYLSRQVKFYSVILHVIDIKRLFQRNKLLYYLERCPFTEYVGYLTI